MNELDRKIAELIMGEPKPEPPSKEYMRNAITDSHDRIFYYSEGGNWHLWFQGKYTEMVWVPLTFSSDLDLAMRAVNTCRYGEGWRQRLSDDELHIRYKASHPMPFRVSVGYNASPSIGAESLPEALCLLALRITESWRPRNENS